MAKIAHNTFRLNPLAAALLLAAAAQMSADQALANSAYGVNTNIAGQTISVPTYYANSPQGIVPAWDTTLNALSPTLKVDTGTPLRKFVDSLNPTGAYNGLAGPASDPLRTLPGGTGLTAGIPLALTEKWVDLNGKVTTDDYYEMAIVEYTEQMHSDLPKETRLRGYVQIETPAIAAGLKDITGVIGSEHIKATYPNGTPILDKNGQQVYFVHQPHYLGPVILAARGTPVRMKVTNYLPYTDVHGASVGSYNGMGGELHIPVDETIAGGGPILDINGVPVNDLNGKPIKMAQNRAGIHWHGGDTPWISDGTPHQWFAPAGDISYIQQVDAAHPHGLGKGDSAISVPDMPEPGDGAYTFYFPNHMSGRMMFYHDHTSGLTRLNVYQGEAAGYVIYDPKELKLVADAIGTTLGATAGGLPTGLLDAVGIPLVLEDKTFVPKNIGPNAVAEDGFTPQSQDAKWNLQHWGQPGDLYFPHVYETNQDPNSADGTNPVGRWDWGPWFWPVFPAQMSLPTGEYGDVTLTPESFLDTATVNGKVYPTMTVDPKTYRFRILNASNDRTVNLGLYQAVDANGVVCEQGKLVAPNVTIPGGVGAPANCTEVRMVPALPTAGYPASWPKDGRVGGVPDPATAGPDIVQIGSEGGLLPAPAIWKSQPVGYDTNVRSITLLNILEHDLLLASAERADVLIDFSKYAGKTLIVYNDAPTPMPASDPRTDHATNGGDKVDAGGAHNTEPGYGPNIRTFMQIKVNPVSTTGGGPLNLSALAAALPVAYAATQPKPNIPESAYNGVFGTTGPNNYASIGTGSGNKPNFTYTVPAYTDVDGVVKTTKTLPIINKAIQELFDPIYGRMNATFGAELPFSTATVATTIPLNYVDVPVERLDAIKDGETQIWKITHNGVDGHPVHFHLVNVQVINRVGWDGTIKPPEANEIGWKETLRMNPLEDVYVAVRATRPVVPFGVPKSSRVLDPAAAVGSTVGFTNIDASTGNAPTYQWQLVNGVNTQLGTVTYSNQLTDFDNEYVWHCHILGHEENDFMRPFIFHPLVLTPDAPAAVTLSGTTLAWTDTTPLGGQDAQGIPTAGTNAAYPEPIASPKNEIGFKVLRNVITAVTTTTPAVLAADGVTVVTPAKSTTVSNTVTDPAALATLPSNGTTWSDASLGTASTATSVTDPVSGVTTDTAVSYSYSVVAYNAAGSSLPGTSATTTAATTTMVTAGPATNVAVGATVTAGPVGPAGLTQTVNPDKSVTLSWTGMAGATGYVVTVNGVALATGPVTGTTVTIPAGSLPAGALTIGVQALALSGNSQTVTTVNSHGVALRPVALTASQANPAGGRGSIALTWANNPGNVNNVSGLMLTWGRSGAPVTGSRTFPANSTGTTIVGLSADQNYNFTLTALSSLGNSPAVTARGLSQP